MTPTEMVRSILITIETVRAVMEDGPVGYVLHTRNNVHFICRNATTLRLGSPLDDKVAVYTTHASAVVAQRYWNSSREEGSTNKVIISLRREAFVAYIDVQQRALDVLTSTGATP